MQLSDGGQVSRQVRGLPDDNKQDITGATRTGWMYNTTTAPSIGSFSIANIGNGNCTNETSDISYINNHFTYNIDTEPDVFYVSAPGLSCQLVYDNANQTFRTIPYKDIKISCQYSQSAAMPGAITSFTITNDLGITYVFAVPEQTSQKIVPNSSGTYFQNTYKQYQNTVVYYDNWYLSSITDANGNGVSLSYTTAPKAVSHNALVLYTGAPGSFTTTLNEYTTNQWTIPEVLSTIQTIGNTKASQVLTFNWTTTNINTSQTMISSITGMGKNLQFNYSPVAFIRPDNSTYTRFFLRSYTDVGCSTPINYQFAYAGETYNPNPQTYSTILADSSSVHIDYWGYFMSPADSSLVPALYVNPLNAAYQRYVVRAQASEPAGSDYTQSLPADVRSTDFANVMAGSLQTITYAEGGNTTLTYESNDYLDVPTNTTIPGGGIRVKQITDNDNISNTSITRTYSYLNPSTGLSSGKPISLPAYAFTTPYTGSISNINYWNYSTIRSSTDLSQEDHTIMYGYAKVSQTGAGYTQYQYYIPAGNWDISAAPGCSGCSTEWTPTTDYVARPTCVSYGSVKNDIDSYPFAPNPNYDFERGLLQKVSTYNDAGTVQASETDYTYQRSSAPGVITAFKFDNNTNALSVTAYAKYNIYYGTGELITTETKKVFDTQGLAQAQQSTVNYTYGSTYHKLASQQSTNSDQSIVTTNYSYTKDYAVTTGSNANINAIYNLQQLNINAPVESYTTIQRNGGQPLLTNASLMLYNGFSSGSSTMYLPSQQLQFVQPNGGSALSPFTISGSSLSSDTRYFPVANYSTYDATGLLQTADDGNKHVQTIITDHYSNHPVLTVKNAAAAEIAFTDYDSFINAPWTSSQSGTFSGTAPAGSHTGKSAGMSNGQAFSYTVSKNVVSNNYIFSIWISSTNSGTFALTLTPTSGSATTTTEPFTNTGGAWQYFEWKLPANTMTSTFTVTATLSSAANIGVDDIIFYPDAAEVSTAAYDTVAHYKIAETNTNGVSAYYTNDQWGRMLYTFDQDKNIVQKNTFVTPVEAASFSPSIAPPANVYVNVPAAFGITNSEPSCASTGITVNWTFGDGSATVTTALTTSPTHTYTATGNYTVTATVNSPLFGSKTTSYAATVTTAPPASIPISITDNATSAGTISAITFTNTVTSVTTSFTGSQIYSAQIPQGQYTVIVSISGGQAYNASTGAGYGSVRLSSNCTTTQCLPFSTHNSYTFTANLSTCTSLNIAVYQTACGS